jgi:predicted methyltransferase
MAHVFVRAEPGVPLSPKALTATIQRLDSTASVEVQRMRESLAPGGLVILVEYRREDVSADHIAIDHRMSVEQVLEEWLPAGFQLLEQVETLPSQHLFVFSARRGARPVP